MNSEKLEYLKLNFLSPSFITLPAGVNRFLQLEVSVRHRIASLECKYLWHLDASYIGSTEIFIIERAIALIGEWFICSCFEISPVHPWQ